MVISNRILGFENGITSRSILKILVFEEHSSLKYIQRRKRDKNALFRFDLTMEEALYLLTNYDNEDTSVHVSGR